MTFLLSEESSGLIHDLRSKKAFKAYVLMVIGLSSRQNCLVKDVAYSTSPKVFPFD